MAIHDYEPVISLTDQDFQEQVLDSVQTVLVLFETEWQGSTHILMPVMQYLAAKYRGRLKVYKMDMDTNQRTPELYGISDRVSLLLFKRGKLMHNITGMTDRENLEEKIIELL